MKAIRIDDRDNAAVALEPLAKGETIQISGREITLKDEIPQGHKFTVMPLHKGSDVLKYGSAIGILQEEADEGVWLHVHNVKTKLDGIREYRYQPGLADGKKQKKQEKQAPCFQGYNRPGGSVGIRNEIWIIPTVGCVNSIARRLASEINSVKPEGVEGVYAFEHPYGCSQMSEDQENTKNVLAGLIRHPNAAGVLVLGLGCENCNVDSLKKVLGPYDANRVAFMECQKYSDEMGEGKRLLMQLADYAGQLKRTEIPLSELIVGLKCGGSDGLSGITANPLVGRFSDWLVSMGGSAVLTEIPEMFGGEVLLMNRCENRETFQKLASLINEYKEYYLKHGQVIYENPSPGNKEGGITTLEDKSLGCIQKGGFSNVRDVVEYGGRIKEKGLTILSSPGNDLVASTALAASGAHLILFTTGRGTPLGSPVPTVKISTNNRLFHQKPDWIDFNAGMLAEGQEMNCLTAALTDLIIEIASGKETKAEENGCRDLAIFKTGVTL